MIKITSATFYYTMHGTTAPAVQDINLHVQEGETIAILGQNGSGKSTLMKLIAAILPPTTGSVEIDTYNTSKGQNELWEIRRRVGIVFQDPDDQLVANTVEEDIAFGPENLGLSRPIIKERVEEALALLDLEPYARMEISKLSIGQKQRVAIAGVLAMHPPYLLLDEPTTMISPHTAQQLLSTVQRLAKEQKITVMHITHFMHEVSFFQRGIVMHKGKIVLDGPPTAIFSQVETLQRLGLDVPVVTHLGRRLRAHGWTHLPETILSIDQLKEQLCS